MPPNANRPPAGFTLEGEQSREKEAAVSGIVYHESEPSGAGGQDPGFDGSAPDDGDIEDHDEPDVEEHV